MMTIRLSEEQNVDLKDPIMELFYIVVLFVLLRVFVSFILFVLLCIVLFTPQYNSILAFRLPFLKINLS